MPVKPLQTPEAFADLMFPVRGLDLSRGYQSQTPGTTTVGTNVRGYEPLKHRERGGARQGIIRFIDEALPLSYVSGSRLIQHLNVIVDPTLDAIADPYTDPEGMAYTADNGTEDPGNPGNYVRTGGSGRGRTRNSSQRKTPEIVWSDPADVNTGTALSVIQLNATARDPDTHLSVPGVFTYDPPSGTVLSDAEEDVPLLVTFHPTEVAVYRSAQKTVHIDVIAGVNDVEYVKSTSDSVQDSGSPHTLSLTLPATTAGNAIVAAFRVDDGVSAGDALADSLGTTYTRIYSSGTLSVWLGVLSSGGSCVLTFTPSFGQYGIVLGAAHEYRYNHASPLDGSDDDGAGNDPAWVVGPVSVSGSGEAVVVFVTHPNQGAAATLSFDAPFVSREEVNEIDSVFGTEKRWLWSGDAVGRSSATTATGTLSTSPFANWLALGLSLKKA